MASMNDIVSGALKRLRVINPRFSPDATAAAEALTALNEMMHSWKTNGIDIGHSTLAATDDFPLGDEYVQGVKALLAIRLSSDHGLEVSQSIVRDAELCWAALQAEFMEAATLSEFDLGLTRMTFGRFS
jgi:hypothetical protein